MLITTTTDHSGTPADTHNYNLLLRDLRLKLDELEQQTGKHYGLTAALPCGTKNIANIDIQTVANTLSELNLMTYGKYLDIQFKLQLEDCDVSHLIASLV